MLESIQQLIETSIPIFIKKLDTSIKFLQEFTEFEKDLFVSKTKTLKDCKDKSIKELHNFLIDNLLSPLVSSLSSDDAQNNKGTALIGKTSFNKLDFVEKLLNEENKIYASIDHNNKIKGFDELANFPHKKYRYSFMIFNNCDHLLKTEKFLQTFLKSINNEIGDSKLWFIFLGEENRLHEVIDINPNATVLMDEFLNKISMYEIT